MYKLKENVNPTMPCTRTGSAALLVPRSAVPPTGDGSVRRMTGKARTTSICWKAVDCPLGKAEGHLAGFSAKVEHESGQDEGYGKAL